MRGWPASARASSIRRSSLVVSSPATRSATAESPTRAIASAASLRASASVRGAHIGADHDVVEHRHARERPHDLEGAADAGRADPCGVAPDMLRPSSSTSPALGCRKPLSRLNSVVLPAPFGPMMPRISPLCSVKLTSCTALRPPKVFERLRTSSITSPVAARCRAARLQRRDVGDGRFRSDASRAPWMHSPAQEIAQLPEHALRREQDDADDGEAEDDALDAGDARAELGVQDLGERDQDRGSRSPVPRPCRRRRTSRRSAPAPTPACRTPRAASRPAAPRT